MDRNISDDNEFHEGIKNSGIFAHSIYSMGKLCFDRKFLDMEPQSLRLWSIHPKYLDGIGLVALWRESLLAQKVLKGETKGYRHHPQLRRFIAHQDEETAMKDLGLLG